MFKYFFRVPCSCTFFLLFILHVFMEADVLKDGSLNCADNFHSRYVEEKVEFFLGFHGVR